METPVLELAPRDYVLPHMLRRAGQMFADRPFVQFPDRARTYAEADEAADRVAHGLHGSVWRRARKSPSWR